MHAAAPHAVAVVAALGTYDSDGADDVTGGTAATAGRVRGRVRRRQIRLTLGQRWCLGVMYSSLVLVAGGMLSVTVETSRFVDKYYDLARGSLRSNLTIAVYYITSVLFSIVAYCVNAWNALALSTVLMFLGIVMHLACVPDGRVLEYESLTVRSLFSGSNSLLLANFLVAGGSSLMSVFSATVVAHALPARFARSGITTGVSILAVVGALGSACFYVWAELTVDSLESFTANYPSMNIVCLLCFLPAVAAGAYLHCVGRTFCCCRTTHSCRPNPEHATMHYLFSPLAALRAEEALDEIEGWAPDSPREKARVRRNRGVMLAYVVLHTVGNTVSTLWVNNFPAFCASMSAAEYDASSAVFYVVGIPFLGVIGLLTDRLERWRSIFFSMLVQQTLSQLLFYYAPWPSVQILALAWNTCATCYSPVLISYLSAICFPAKSDNWTNLLLTCNALGSLWSLSVTVTADNLQEVKLVSSLVMLASCLLLFCALRLRCCGARLVRHN